MSRKQKVGLGVIAGLLFFSFIWVWCVNRVYVPEGYSLRLRYKGPLLFGERKESKPGHWAEDGEIGVRAKMVGPGRHFYCPIWWERELVPDVVIKPGEVGVVTCKLGDALPEGEFLVDGELGETTHKGTLRKVLGPGRYRANPYGYEVKVIGTEVETVGKATRQSGWVKVPTGYVGVVTNKAKNPLTKQAAGIQDKVLPPGLYPTNPQEQTIDIVEIGYHETTVAITTSHSAADIAKQDDAGEPIVLNGGISFPSNDGFKITMDFTAIWGLMPNQAPNAIRKYGNLDLVETKIVQPQIESICRNNGSEYSATQLLVGKEREEFQSNTLTEFKNVLKEKEINVLYGLVRHIYIPREVREPIQTAFIADELKLTRDQEQMTAKAEGELREAERKVGFETSKVQTETLKMIAERRADGQKVVGETKANTRRLIAAVDKETAQLKADSLLVLGQAENDGKKMIAEARASKFKLAVEAFGTPDAYNKWVFATGLPDNIDIRMLYAGPGTLWTDLKNGPVLTVPAPVAEPKK